MIVNTGDIRRWKMMEKELYRQDLEATISNRHRLSAPELPLLVWFVTPPSNPTTRPSATFG